MRRKKSSLSITNIKEALYGIQSVDTILSNFFITRSKKKNITLNGHNHICIYLSSLNYFKLWLNDRVIQMRYQKK